MKNLITIILVLIQFPLLSQSLNGKFQIGGSASFYMNNSEYERNSTADSIQRKADRNTIEILPHFGYFINDFISISAQLGYLRHSSNQYYQSNQTDASEYNIKDNVLLIGTFTRIHKSISENLYLFLQGDMRVDFGKQRSDENPNINQNHIDFRAGIQPGILYMISEKIGVEGKFGFLGYNSSVHTLVDSDDELYDKTEGFRFSFNSNTIAVGIQFYL